MPVKITDDELKAFGITTNHEIMDNGEARFRLAGADGTSYIRNENAGKPVWENSHSHARLKELLLVSRGCVVLAELIEAKARFTLLGEGDIAITRPGVPHNECVSGGSVVHTIKFGDCSKPDWIPCPELDALTKALSFSQACGLAGKPDPK